MAMLNFYINRAGKNLSLERKSCLQQAKDELRGLFHRPRNAGGIESRILAANPGPTGMPKASPGDPMGV